MQKLLDFDVAIEPLNDAYRTRVIASPAGEAQADFTIPFSDKDLEIFVLKVIGSIGRVRRKVRRIESEERRLLEAFGGQLFQAAFSARIRECLGRSLFAAEGSGAGLRIRLRLPPALANIPWEYLYDREYGFIGLSPETALVRYVEMPAPVRPFPISPPLRILAMISAPSDVPWLQGDQEWDNLNEALSALVRRGMVEAERLETGTLSALQRPLRLREYHVLHFVGHGRYDEAAQDGALALEGADRRTRLVTGRDLGLMIRGYRTLRLVVLNACEGARSARDDPLGGVAQALVRQGIPAVIAMQFEISDPAALVFSRSLYEAIADGFPVDVAMAEARRAMFAEGHEVEWATPVLYLRSPDGHIFAQAGISEAEREAWENADYARPSRIARHALPPTSAATAHAEQGDSFREQRRYADAETAYRAALKLDPHLARAHAGLGEALYGLQQYDGAEAACQEAIRLDPANPVTYRVHGDILRGLRHWTEAETAYQQAIRLDSSPAAVHELIPVLEDLKRRKEADADTARQKQPQHASPARAEASQIDLTIGLVGSKGSGKTVLMTVMVKYLCEVVGRRFGADVRFATANPGGYQGLSDYQASREIPLYVNRILPTTTPRQQGIAGQRPTPVVLRWRQALSHRLRGSTMRSTALSFFDTAGEDLTDMETVFTLEYLSACDALIITLDPFTFPSARARLSLPPAAIQVDDDEPMDVVSRITELLRTEHRVKYVNRISIPVAIVITKIDALYSALALQNPLLAVPKDQPAYDDTDGRAVHENILSLLHDWNVTDINNHMRINYSNYRYFGVSALGAEPDYESGMLAPSGVQPHRVEDPALWLMSNFRSVAKI